MTALRLLGPGAALAGVYVGVWVCVQDVSGVPYTQSYHSC